jgi:hypothetical protein
MARFLKFVGRLNRESNRRRKFPRLKRFLAWFSVFLLLPLPYGLLNPRPVRAQAQGTFGGFMELTSVFFGEGSRTFGPGQVITVSGSIPFIPWCPSMALPGVTGRGEGLFDFFPVADFYVIKDDGQPLQPYQKLVDVSGTPNRITGGPQGVFIDEVVAITKPAGNVGPGRYKIVMDQCLDGRFDPFIDIVLGDPPNLGFEVVATGALPAINYHLLKDRAKDYAEELSGTKLGALGVSVTIPGFCNLYGKLVAKSQAAGALFSFGKIALDRCADLIAEQKGIAADPPDPNYTQFAELGPLAYDFTDIPGTPLERATRDLAHSLTDQAAITKALLISIERFQGAQAASNDEFTILQMQTASKYIDLLIGPGGAVLRFYANLEAFDFALQQDPLGSQPEAADLHAFVPEMRQVIGGLLLPLGTALNDSRVNGTDTFTPIGLQEWITVYVGNDPFLPSLGLPGIPQIRAQNGLPPIAFHHPISNPGGAYNVPPGRMITFDASKSSDPDGDTLTFAWDLTGSGAFSDATGAVVQFSYSQPGTRLVGVKATDPTGNTNVSYTLVKIGDVNAQDIITMPLSREIFRVSPDGNVTTLKPGIGGNFGGLIALHVDLNGDIWVLNQTYFEHYNSTGALLNTISINQVGSLVGVPLFVFNDFTLDGRGDILVLARTATPTTWKWKLLRLAKDASRASFIADVSQGPGGCSGGDSPSLAIDNAGKIVVAAAGGPAPQFPFANTGIWRVDPTNGSVEQVIPYDAGTNCGLIPSPFGPFQQIRLFFGTADLFAYISGERYNGGIKVDSRGDYIAGFGPYLFNPRLYRIFIPPELSLAGINLGLQVFPIQLDSAGSSAIAYNDFAMNSSGDFLEAGVDYSGQFGAGIFRVTPDSSVFKVVNLSGPFSALAVLDVVPGVRQVTPKDLPPDPTIHLDAISISQDFCPGAATLHATVSNTGSGPLQAPVRVLWLDGDPEGGGAVIGSALVPVPLKPGVPVDLSASWPNPTPGMHQVFAIAMGANTVSAIFMVCVPTTFLSNPVLLSPPSGTTTVGNPYTVSALVRDALGNGVSGLPVTFNVSNTNAASGTATTDAGGRATFSYSGTKSGLDNIVATATGATSNSVTDLWQGAANQPPIANAGPNQVLEATSPAGATALLSAAASSDPDGDLLSFTWTGPFGTLAGISISPTLPLGTTKVMLAVNDGHGNIANASVNITVRDTTPPVVAPPAAISVAATEAGGARGNSSAALAAFLAGGTATDIVDRSPTRLTPQVGGLNVDINTLFAIGSTTPVSFRFQDASGNVGTAISKVTVVLGTPRITGFVAAKGLDPSGAYYVDVRLTNTGTGNARNLKITTINPRMLSGTGTVSYNSSLSPPLPVTVGNLDAGISATFRLFLGVPSTVTKFSVTEGGPVQDVLGTNYNYSTAQAVYP